MLDSASRLPHGIKYDVKLEVLTSIATPSENELATAKGNVHKSLVNFFRP